MINFKFNFIFKSYIKILFFSHTDKKPISENIEIFTIQISEQRLRVIKKTLAELWHLGCTVRINNFGDKEKVPHSEKDIKNQVSCHRSLQKLCGHIKNYCK